MYVCIYVCGVCNHNGVITHLESDIPECGLQVGLRKHHYKQS